MTGPVKVASVTTAPSPIRALVTVARGGAGRGRAAGEDVARAVAAALAGRDEDGEDGAGCTGAGELHAATAHTLATAAAVRSLRIILPVPATMRRLCQAAPSA